MLHTITKRLEIYININIESLTLEITFLPNKYFFLQMAYELLSQSRKFNRRGAGVLIRSGGWKIF